MIIREAKIDDTKQIQIVRNSVTENTLSNPNLLTDEDCEEFITKRGMELLSLSAQKNERIRLT